MSSSSKSLADLADRYWRFQSVEFPLMAIMAGEPVESEVVMRGAPDDYERREQWSKGALAELHQIEATSLGDDDRVTLALLERELRGHIDVVAVRAHLRPSLYPLGPDFMLGNWARSTKLGSADSARRYIARLTRVAAALDDLQTCLSQGIIAGMRYPVLVIDRAVALGAGILGLPLEQNPFFGPLAPLRSRGALFERLADEGASVVVEALMPAFARYYAFLDTQVRVAARPSLSAIDDPDGAAFYAFLIEQNTTLRKGADEIHAVGLSEIERITAEMVETAATAGFPNDLAGFRFKLGADSGQIAESGEALRESMEVLSKRIDGRLPELFGHLPRSSYGVSSIPLAVAAAMPPAYAQPNPADRSAAGIHWITSIPTKLPRYLHLPIALHEAWPGHLMHLALIQEMDALPAFRRHGALRYSACLEGWALYCERLGEDLGLYDTPEKRYGRLEMEMWRAVRLVVDTGIHSLGWSRAQAIDCFHQNMALPAETVEAEVDRYVGLPGQALGYQLGNLRFRAIRALAESTLGEQFQIRDFHDALMATGAVTLGVLDMVMSDWIAMTAVKTGVAFDTRDAASDDRKS